MLVLKKLPVELQLQVLSIDVEVDADKLAQQLALDEAAELVEAILDQHGSKAFREVFETLDGELGDGE